MSSLWLNMAPQCSLSRQMIVWALQRWGSWKCCRLLQEIKRTKGKKQQYFPSIHPSMFFLRRLCLSRFMVLEHSRESLRLEDEEHLRIKKINRCLYLDIFELWEDSGACTHICTHRFLNISILHIKN